MYDRSISTQRKVLAYDTQIWKLWTRCANLFHTLPAGVVSLIPKFHLHIIHHGNFPLLFLLARPLV